MEGPGQRTWFDRLMTPFNQAASRRFMAECAAQGVGQHVAVAGRPAGGAGGAGGPHRAARDGVGSAGRRPAGAGAGPDAPGRAGLRRVAARLAAPRRAQAAGRPSAAASVASAATWPSGPPSPASMVFTLTWVAPGGAPRLHPRHDAVDPVVAPGDPGVEAERRRVAPRLASPVRRCARGLRRGPRPVGPWAGTSRRPCGRCAGRRARTTPPIHMGIGCCTGRGSMPAAVTRSKRPSWVTTGSVHSRRSTSICSSMRRPRVGEVLAQRLVLHRVPAEADRRGGGGPR